MLICEKCKQDVYIQQRVKIELNPLNAPYYCWYCEEFKNYNEVETEK